MTGQLDRARVRAAQADHTDPLGQYVVVGHVEAGTVAWTTGGPVIRGRSGGASDGPQSDHLALLLRRQRRRQALRRGILWWGSWVRPRRRTVPASTSASPPVPAPTPRPATTTALPRSRRPLDDIAPEWLSDGDVRRLLTATRPTGQSRPEVLDLRERPWRRSGDPVPELDLDLPPSH